MKKLPRFEIYRRRNAQFGVRLLAANNRIIAALEGYASRRNARRAISRLKSIAFFGETRDLTVPTKPTVLVWTRILSREWGPNEITGPVTLVAKGKAKS